MSQHLKHFTEKDIDSFREAFYLFAKNRKENPIYIRSVDELCVIMRSLGLSPTIREITSYMKKYGNKMSFSDFLEVVHKHSGGKVLLVLAQRCQLFAPSLKVILFSFQLKSSRMKFLTPLNPLIPKKLVKLMRESCAQSSQTGVKS